MDFTRLICKANLKSCFKHEHSEIYASTIMQGKQQKVTDLGAVNLRNRMLS